MDNEAKVCTHCGIEKSVATDFSPIASRPGKYLSWCRKCSRIQCAVRAKAASDAARELKTAVRRAVTHNFTVKVCTHCGIEKPMSEFYSVNRNNNVSGRVQSWCKMCTIDRPSIHRDARLFKQYGIDLADYEVLLESQDGVCAICGLKRVTNGSNMVVDHGHLTGQVRGILCQPCNSAIGLLGDSSETVSAAYFYLAKWEVQEN